MIPFSHFLQMDALMQGRCQGKCPNFSLHANSRLLLLLWYSNALHEQLMSSCIFQIRLIYHTLVVPPAITMRGRNRTKVLEDDCACLWRWPSITTLHYCFHGTDINRSRKIRTQNSPSFHVLVVVGVEVAESSTVPRLEMASSSEEQSHSPFF